MRIISNSALRKFYTAEPASRSVLQGWRRVIEQNRFEHWAALKATFRAIDKVGQLTVFDLGGNKYRLIAYIRFDKQILYIKAVLHHRDYDEARWRE